MMENALLLQKRKKTAARKMGSCLFELEKVQFFNAVNRFGDTDFINQ